MDGMTKMVDGFIKSKGLFKYDDNRAFVLVDQGIADFYRSIIPKSIFVNPQRYPAHISVVRNEIPPNMTVWGKYQGIEIDFEYFPTIMQDETYFWLDVRCNKLEEIREELGLKAFPPWRNMYHITIGNCKEIE